MRTFQQRQRERATALRPAFTLIELLVVIIILGIALTMAATMMRPLMEETKLREAARLLNVFIAGTQARAVEVNRPVGVLLERLAPDPANPNFSACVQVYVAETPPAYGGDSLLSFARNVQPAGAGLYSAQLVFADLAAARPGGGPGLVRAGDLIKFDYKGEMYRIVGNPTPVSGNPPATTVMFSLVRPDGSLKPPPLAKTEFYAAGGNPQNLTGVPFQVFRSPRKTSADPLQLPETTVVDLGSSGVGPTGVFASVSDDPVVVSFTPGGSIDYIYETRNTANPHEPARPIGAVHFLIGRLGKTSAENLADQTSRWVSISQQSGVVTTVENLGTGNLAQARELATQRQQTASQ